MKEFENYKTAVVSTAHLPEELAAQMERGEVVGFFYEKAMFGFLVWVPTDDIEEYIKAFPAPLAPLIMEAHKQECKFVNFDQGGLVYDFRTWEW